MHKNVWVYIAELVDGLRNSYSGVSMEFNFYEDVILICSGNDVLSGNLLRVLKTVFIIYLFIIF